VLQLLILFIEIVLGKARGTWPK